MEKIDRPKELIRYDSYNGIKEGRKKIFTTRVLAYSAVLTVLILIQGFLLASRSDVETLLLRTPGMLFQKTAEGDISNLYNYQIINKTNENFTIEFKLLDFSGEIQLIGEQPKVEENNMSEGALFIVVSPEELKGRKNKIRLGVYSNGKLIDEVTTNFFGPVK